MSDLKRLNNLIKSLTAHSEEQRKVYKDIAESEQKEKTKFFSGNKWECILIKSGYTMDPNFESEYEGEIVAARRYYSETVLKEAVKEGLFDGVPMMLRSEDEHLNNKNGSAKNIAGYFHSAKWNEKNKSVESIFDIWSSRRTRLEKLWNFGIELSIVGKGHYTIERFLNGYAANVTSITEIVSVDAVASANAGGKIISPLIN